MKNLTLSDTFSFEQYAYHKLFVETKDLNETLLDSTMTLMGSGTAYGHGGNANFPGSAGGMGSCKNMQAYRLQSGHFGGHL